VVFVVEAIDMTQEEKHIVMRRYSQLHSHYLQLISSDPDNARYYKIMVEHYRRQYRALGDKDQEEQPQKSNNIFI
jgi:hypothetical protein